jgi:hypothetical protein
MGFQQEILFSGQIADAHIQHERFVFDQPVSPEQAIAGDVVAGMLRSCVNVASVVFVIEGQTVDCAAVCYPTLPTVKQMQSSASSGFGPMDAERRLAYEVAMQFGSEEPPEATILSVQCIDRLRRIRVPSGYRHERTEIKAVLGGVSILSVYRERQANFMELPEGATPIAR